MASVLNNSPAAGRSTPKQSRDNLITVEVAIPAIDALRSDLLRVKISRENVEHAIYVRQVGSMLIKLALQLVNDAGEFAALLDKAGNNMILAGGHSAFRCQLASPYWALAAGKLSAGLRSGRAGDR